MANRYVAGASGLPFAVLRGYSGTDLPQHTSTISTVTFTGEELAAVAALNPDVTIVHAQRADRDANVQLWEITGIQKEAVLATRRALVGIGQPRWTRRGSGRPFARASATLRVGGACTREPGRLQEGDRAVVAGSSDLRDVAMVIDPHSESVGELFAGPGLRVVPTVCLGDATLIANGCRERSLQEPGV